MSISVEQQVVSADAAQKAVAAAVVKAEELGIKVNAAVVDSGGNLTAFLRMPGAFLQSIAIAQDKALSAAGIGLSTRALYELIGTSQALKDGILQQPNFAAIGGGYPIKDGGAVIGGIGVSGASEDEDEACALAGLEAIGGEV